MRNALTLGVAAFALLATANGSRAEDDRQLVEMPEMMQQHMLTNMRDHLKALEEILADISAEKYDDAANVAEERLGMSSLERHHASHMAPYMPKPMQDAGIAFHRAASRFAIVAKNVDVERSYDAMKQLNASLSDMIVACNVCHASYRIH
ncbi:hypothetical protein [Methylocapsa aurea]|uniref:hypothetical protein n=1 Tax=Methylocapsa aurea TaxID=663610 RepID=UPI00055F54FE|nr:hypothetical protein [Methylocapsa aurea]